jgi:hypothetical protein
MEMLVYWDRAVKKLRPIAGIGLRITLLLPLSPDKLLLLHLLLKRIIIKSKKLLKICQRK